MGDTDDIFLKRFSLVIAVLVAITIFIIIIAINSVVDSGEDKNPSRLALTNARTLPVGAVRTELTAEDLAAAQAPVQAPGDTPDGVAVAPADYQVADTSGIDGEAVYASICQACHLAGVAGSPVPGTDLWAERAEKGLATLAYNAINGLNAMPARGGNPNLTDAEVTAAVEHMLAQ